MYLVDTNVISEARKGTKANPGVRAFWQSTRSGEIHIAVQTVGEIRQGLETIRTRGDRQQAGILEAWLDGVVEHYSDHILAFDIECAQVWGKLMAPDPQHPIDKQIAAIALMHDLTVVTRNGADFDGTGVKLLDPFTPISLR